MFVLGSVFPVCFYFFACDVYWFLDTPDAQISCKIQYKINIFILRKSHHFLCLLPSQKEPKIKKICIFVSSRKLLFEDVFAS